MAHDIIMPALGMAQDSGLLVAWRKKPGDAVKPGDALFEVETDKATMEVEAAHAGFLSAVTAFDGQDVPVGQVIARIVATEAEVERTAPAKVEAAPAQTAPTPTAQTASAPPAPPAAAQASPAQPAPSAKPAPLAKMAPSAKPAAAPTPAPQTPGRILASPKAKALAEAQGLDLSRLVKAGHPQPFHVADLDRLRALPASARATLSARVDGGALSALMQKATQADMGRVIASFARRAWETVTDEPLTVAMLRPDGAQEGEGALLLIDLTETRLAAYTPPEGLALSIGREGATVTLTLSFDDGALPFPTAAAWLDEIAARVEDPLRQLI